MCCSDRVQAERLSKFSAFIQRPLAGWPAWSVMLAEPACVISFKSPWQAVRLSVSAHGTALGQRRINEAIEAGRHISADYLRFDPYTARPYFIDDDVGQRVLRIGPLQVLQLIDETDDLLADLSRLFVHQGDAMWAADDLVRFVERTGLGKVERVTR